MLASRLVSRAPDITRLLDKLEERGLIERERPADNRRMVLIGLTDNGTGPAWPSLDEQVRAMPCPADWATCRPTICAHLIALLKAARAPHEEPGSHWLPRGMNGPSAGSLTGVERPSCRSPRNNRAPAPAAA